MFGDLFVRHQGVAVVLGDVVLVGDQNRSNGWVVFVGKAGVGVHMGQVLFGKALHCLLNALVHVGVAFEVNPGLALGQLIEVFDVVMGGKGALYVHVEPHVNAFVLQALDPQVDLAQRLGIELLGIANQGAVAKHVRADPGGVMVVQPDEVEAQCRQPFGLLGNFFVWRLEQRVRRQVGAPETHGGVVFEYQLLAGGLYKPALACRYLWRIEK
ncbi:hypothetical protein D3C81_812360 [compost metagenome]